MLWNIRKILIPRQQILQTSIKHSKYIIQQNKERNIRIKKKIVPKLTYNMVNVLNKNNDKKINRK